MRRTTSAAFLGLATTASVISAMTFQAGVASADPNTPKAPSTSAPSAGSDVRNPGPNVKAQLSTKGARQFARGQEAAAAGNAEVGDTKTFLGLNDVSGQYELRDYTLMSLGENIEVWVSQDRAFPDGDCRNDLGLTDITQAQTDSFVTEFDDNILPKESESFSVAPDQDGSTATLPGQIGEADDYYQVDADQADDVVVLVDNVRDANYYDPGTPDGQTYIAGFFSTQLNSFFGRNVMSIDAYDWLHRTGASTPNDLDDPAYIACAADLGLNRPLGSPNPRLYEGTFAHEYQHLLESYEDPDEETWVNEGLSDYAQTLVGYVDTTLPPSDPDSDSHLNCFNGFSDPAFGGPENSLTRWQDQGGPEILCDYGATYSMMMYLESHYGEGFMSALHSEDANGLAGLDAVLDQVGSNKSAMDTVHSYLGMVALDAALDKGGKLTGDKKAKLTASELSSRVNFDNPQAYNSPGAPTNGADYVRLRGKGQRNYLSAAKLRTLTFKGQKSLAPAAPEWTVDATPPGVIPSGDETCSEDLAPGDGPAALYSGCGPDLDRSLAHSIAVPATGDATLSFDVNFDLESAYDFAFAQISTDGGATWTSLETEDTVGPEAAAPDVDADTVALLPGFNGESGGFKTQTADLSEYAGDTVLIGFRYIGDPAVNEAGLWVRNIGIGDTTVPTDSLDGWSSYEALSPVQIPSWTVQLVGIKNTTGDAWIHTLDLNDNFYARMNKSALRKVLGSKAGTVAAIVTADDPSESISAYPTYKLVVNDKLQPGGGR